MTRLKRALFALLVSVCILPLAAPAAGSILEGKLLTSWGFSHKNNDDVLLGKVGTSHEHCYFGSTVTNGTTNAPALMAGGTTALMRDNKSAYWHPSIVFPDGTSFCPSGASAYYGTFGKESTSMAGGHVQPPPFNMGFITGNSASTVRQSSSILRFRCGGLTPTYSSPPVCPTDRAVVFEYTAPSCWDGLNLRSENGKTHVAYPSNRLCPASHPVGVPQLYMGFNFPATITARLNTEAWKLSSDLPGVPKAASGHFDTLWAWGPSGLEMTKCLNDPLRDNPNSPLCEVITYLGADNNLFRESRDVTDWARPVPTPTPTP